MQIPLPGVRPFPIDLSAVAAKENSGDVSKLLSLARDFARSQGIKILSMGSDSASVERAAQAQTLQDPTFKRKCVHFFFLFSPVLLLTTPIIRPDLTYTNKYCSIDIRIPVFESGPLVAIPDPLHSAKSLRNFLTSGAKFPLLGNSTIHFTLLDSLLTRPNPAILTSDVHNVDRQGDGPPKRLFGSATLLSTTDGGAGIKVLPQYNGFFIFSFVFGSSFLCSFSKSALTGSSQATSSMHGRTAPSRTSSARSRRSGPSSFSTFGGEQSAT
jgi:hypothetical protein